MMPGNEMMRGTVGLLFGLHRAEKGHSSAVQCHDMVYAGCQDILYTWMFRSVFDMAFAESAEGARRATVADFANAARGATSAFGFSPIGSISRMYMSR